MPRIQSDEEYEATMNEIDERMARCKDPHGPEGQIIDRLIARAEEYENRVDERVTSWICARCARSLNPDIAECEFCSEHYAQSCPSRQEHNDRLDQMLMCDENFAGRGC